MKASRYTFQYLSGMEFVPGSVCFDQSPPNHYYPKKHNSEKNMQTLQISKFYQRNKKVLLLGLIVRDHLIISSNGEPGKPR